MWTLRGQGTVSPVSGLREEAVGESLGRSGREGTLEQRGGNASPDSRRYRPRVRISQMRIQVEPRTFLVRPEPKTGSGRFLRFEPNTT